MKRERVKKIIQYALRIVIILVLSLIFGLTVYSVNAKTVRKDQMPMPFNVAYAVVLTGSMEPELSVDDLLIVKKTNDYQINDIVVFQEYNTLVVHRIIRIEGDKIITKGDANDSEDAPITKDFIKGEVVKVYEGAGVYLNMIRSPLGILVISLVAISLLVLSYKKEKKDDDNKIKSIKDEIRRLKKEIEDQNKK